MTIQEIFVLNRAIDGKQIVGLPAFAELHIAEPTIALNKQNLMRKGLLATPDSFTTKGVEMVWRMKQYKEAVRYIGVNAVTFGLSAEGKMSAMWYNPVRKAYTFTLVESGDMAAQITVQYPFLAQGSGEAKLSEGEKETSLNFSEKELQGKKTAVTVSTHTAQANDINKDSFFTEKGRLYWYDWKAKKLKRTCPAEVAAFLKERFAL